MVNYTGRGEHAPAHEICTQACGTRAPARVMQVNDWAGGLVMTMG